MSNLCDERKLHLYFDNELNENEKIILLNHLEKCVKCKENFLEINKINDLLSNIYSNDNYKVNLTSKILEKYQANFSNNFFSLFNNFINSNFKKLSVTWILSLFLIIFISFTSFKNKIINTKKQNNKIEVLESFKAIPSYSLAANFKFIESGESNEK